jgi:hypothetical protein
MLDGKNFGGYENTSVGLIKLIDIARIKGKNMNKETSINPTSIKK